MEDCMVAVGERPSESALAALEAKQAAAADAHNRIMEAEAPWMAERARRKPHMGLGRATPGRRQGGHNEADEVVAGAAVAAQAAAPANRVEAALFDRGDSEASAAQAPMEAGAQASLWNSTFIAEAPVSMIGIVQLTSMPAGPCACKCSPRRRASPLPTGVHDWHCPAHFHAGRHQRGADPRLLWTAGR